MTQNISKDYAYFLKMEKAYSNFMVNTRKCDNPYQLGYFDWKKTPQGYEYWCNLNYKFIRFLNKKYNCDVVMVN